jgi:putative tryptophan/tyrosine transport system substrate-binding protein
MSVAPEGSDMRRRNFIAGLASATMIWPVAARALRAGKLPTIGFLGAVGVEAGSLWVAALVQRLHELGWIEGQTIAIMYLWAEGRIDRSAELAAELVRRKVEIIVAEGTASVIAAKQATTVIPIVFPLAGDPLSNNLVASLARPEGNVTGLSIQQTDLAGKRVELLREIVPGLRRLAILANIASPNTVPEIREVQILARSLNFNVTELDIRRPDDIAPAFDAIKGRADAVYIPADPLVFTNRIRLATLALDMRLPTIYSFREYVEAGGLVSYGPDIPALFGRAADLVDKILRGTKVSDIPVEQPTKFELVINLKTAKALGLTVPESLLVRADEVIE